jgi:hypothetical protein
MARVTAESRFPAAHVDAHHGAVLYRDGDDVGAGVNLAAGVTSASGAGQFPDHRERGGGAPRGARPARKHDCLADPEPECRMSTSSDESGR